MINEIVLYCYNRKVKMQGKTQNSNKNGQKGKSQS